VRELDSCTRDLESWAEGKDRLVGSPMDSGSLEGQGSWMESLCSGVEGLCSGMVGLGSWTTKKIINTLPSVTANMS
jgi:hypothetical protein